MKPLSLAELGMLPEGTKVVFAAPFDIFDDALIPAGTTAVIKENGFSEIWSAMLVLPDDPDIRAKLKEWDGCVYIKGGDPSGSLIDETWTALSPLALPNEPQSEMGKAAGEGPASP